MKTTMKMVFLSTAALLVCAASAFAETKVTVGVGHMCCGSCKKSATAALEKVASDISIDGKNVTMTLKQNDIAPALEALRRGGFPPTHVDAGAAPVTLAVAHMCCAHCVTDLKASLADAKIEGLDMDSVKAEMGTLVVKAKAGSSLDLMPVLAAMEKGGFSATKITVEGKTAFQSKKAATKTVALQSHSSRTAHKP